MTQFHEAPSTVLRATARLHAHQTGSSIRKELKKYGSLQLFAEDLARVPVDPVKLKDILGDVHADWHIRHFDSPVVTSIFDDPTGACRRSRACQTGWGRSSHLSSTTWRQAGDGAALENVARMAEPESERGRVPDGCSIAAAIDYSLNGWTALTRNSKTEACRSITTSSNAK